ncbi:MAG: P-loop NTPase [Phycisphaerales bacterium]|nr:P-loop NTPase [Phycisphaerales bacterium]
MSGQILLVESATAGEGKTTVLARFAIRLASGGLRVVMVDADLQQPSLHHLFGLKNGKERGLTNAISRTISHDIRKGSLTSCSVSDLFSLISLKKQSGQLIITNDFQTMTAVFDNGRLFHIQSKDFPIENRLGTVLLRGSFITEGQLKDALERNQRTRQPLGYILINAGYINQSQLQGPLKLQMEEHLQKLFSWKHGTFAFEPGRVETYEDKRIYFGEDYTPIINRLSRMAGSRLLENDILSYVKPVHDQNLSLLSAGTGHPRLDGPIYFKVIEKYFEILKQRYDVVLVDAPPVLNGGNSATTLFSLVDDVIFVVKAGHASIDLINKAIGTIKESKANIVGTVLNWAKIGKGYYYN